MLVAGSVLNPDLTYGLCFLGFVIASTWALTLFHLRREMEDNLLVKHAADRASERVEVRRILDSRRIVNGRFFLGTGALSFAVFLFAALVFLALPRVGVGFFLKARGGLTLAGFSDGVQLGGHGVIKNDATVVMRVEIAGRYGGRDAPEIHWRGVAFDHYETGKWSRKPDAPARPGVPARPGAPRTLQTLEQSATRDRRFLRWDGPPLTSAAIDALAGQLVTQEIWLDPLDSDVLFGASAPRIVEYTHTLRPRRALYEHNDEIRLDHGTTVHYTVWSQLTPPSADDPARGERQPARRLRGLPPAAEGDHAADPRARPQDHGRARHRVRQGRRDQGVAGRQPDLHAGARRSGRPGAGRLLPVRPQEGPLRVLRLGVRGARARGRDPDPPGQRLPRRRVERVPGLRRGPRRRRPLVGRGVLTRARAGSRSTRRRRPTSTRSAAAAPAGPRGWAGSSTRCGSSGTSG